MRNPAAKLELIATCAFGLEKLVFDEIKQLGLWVIKKEDGRVFFEATPLDLIRTNLWLRCADRVQIKMGEFTAKTFDELFDQTFAIDWAGLIGPNDSFPIQATSVKSLLHSEPAIQSIVKKAIVKKLQSQHNTENLPENSTAVYQIIVKSNKDNFIISIDSSGDSLHKRGYRTQANLAPIKETLAAALVKLSDWTPDRTLVDPFCGSGTIAIEAALIARNIAPGIKRDFAFKKWPWISQEDLEAAYLEARNSAKESSKLPIYCFDIDPDSLIIAKDNAARAGIEHLNFKRADFQDLDFSKFENCTFITNPPYGERMGDGSEIQELYRNFGDKFTQSKNCSLFIITADETFPELFGKPADKNRKLFNGNIRCYLYQYMKST
jgi:putative N6-adenine-specific DNA methylase